MTSLPLGSSQGVAQALSVYCARRSGAEPLVLACEAEAPVSARAAIANHYAQAEDCFGAFQALSRSVGR